MLWYRKNEDDIVNLKDLSQYAIAPIQISERNKEKALLTVKAKKGIVHIIDSQSVLAPIMMDIFQKLRIDSKVFFAFPRHNRFDFNLFSRNEVVIYHVSKTYT